MRRGVLKTLRLLPVAAGLLLAGSILLNVSALSKPLSQRASGQPAFAQRLFPPGRPVFRSDTFGDQSFWGGALQLHRAIEGSKLGGVGPGLSPKGALAAGLK